MSEALEIRRMKDLIKTIMRKKGRTYEELAKVLKVSPTTVKRVLNKDDLTLQRLHEILAWLGLTFAEVATLSEQGGKEGMKQYSTEQEQFLAKNLDYLCIWEGLVNGMSPEQLAKKYRLNAKSLQKYLFTLDKHDLIELLSNGRVRTKPMMAWRKNGPVRTQLSDRLAKVVNDLINQGMRFGRDYPRFGFRAVVDAPMRRKTYEQLQQELDEIVTKYLNISATEKALEAREDLINVTFVHVAANIDAAELYLDRPRNFEDTLQVEERV